jgi:hypothetical protein
MPSTVIRSYQYDAASRQLSIVFQSGRRYQYQDVPPEIHDAMKTAFAKGEFFNRYVRGRYACVRSSSEPPVHSADQIGLAPRSRRCARRY